MPIKVILQWVGPEGRQENTVTLDRTDKAPSAILYPGDMGNDDLYLPSPVKGSPQIYIAASFYELANEEYFKEYFSGDEEAEELEEDDSDLPPVAEALEAQRETP